MAGEIQVRLTTKENLYRLQVAGGEAHGHTAVCKKHRKAKYYYLYTEENCEWESSINSVAQTEHAELSGSVVKSPAAFYGEA